MSRPKKERTEGYNIVTAAKTGDRLETLIALRDFLAESLQATESTRDISSISRRLMQCVTEIEALTKQREYAQEHSFTDFMKKHNLLVDKINRQNTLNQITTEHEVN